MKYDIAFIIPAYNIGDFISLTIESILKQSDVKSQIIIVNDGSVDNTLRICKDLSAIHMNITVIDKKNEGVSIARNIGIESSDAEYICFIDGDDVYLHDFASLFLSICRANNLDILRGRYKRFGDTHDNTVYPRHTISHISPISGRDFLAKSISKKNSEIVPWLGMFKAEFLKKNKLHFPIGITYTEDQLFFLQALLVEGCRVMDIDNCFYGYRVRQGSAVNNGFSMKKVDDILYITTLEMQEALQFSHYKKFIYKYASATLAQVIPFYNAANRHQKKDVINLFKRLNFIPLLFNSYSTKTFLKIFLLRFLPQVLNLIYR